MTEIEQKACERIDPWLVRYPFGTIDYRRAKELGNAANRPAPRITDLQAEQLWDLVRRYRRQVVSPAVIAEADRLTQTGD